MIQNVTGCCMTVSVFRVQYAPGRVSLVPLLPRLTSAVSASGRTRQVSTPRRSLTSLTSMLTASRRASSQVSALSARAPTCIRGSRYIGLVKDAMYDV